jgi:uncharacterized protein YmfQ (DUF2313 family)
MLKIVLAVGLTAAIGWLGSANAADRVGKDDSDNARFSERTHKGDWERGKEDLARSLKIGEDKAFYRRELAKLGYQVTSINYDKPDYVEYEVVKGDQTYEIQIDIDKASRRAKKIDVTANLYKADATDRVLKGNKLSDKEKTDQGLFHARNSRFSDRDHKSGWEKGKEELVRSLKIGEEKPFYRRELQKMDYQVTSVNADKPEYAEYEIVKGDRTYEIGIDFDKNSHRASKVDVGTNMWRTKETEEALKRNQDKSQAKR